jgi:hypothetical protein
MANKKAAAKKVPAASRKPLRWGFRNLNKCEQVAQLHFWPNPSNKVAGVAFGQVPLSAEEYEAILRERGEIE